VIGGGDFLFRGPGPSATIEHLRGLGGTWFDGRGRSGVESCSWSVELRGLVLSVGRRIEECHDRDRPLVRSGLSGGPSARRLLPIAPTARWTSIPTIII
jgi:hypothetical protein